MATARGWRGGVIVGRDKVIVNKPYGTGGCVCVGGSSALVSEPSAGAIDSGGKIIEGIFV
ncbi:MAG TPA: hypothetical protein PLM08_25045 [Polyangiaceae bacterium]|nr:hypothetical protein [Polyangiaceae bacterium]